MRKKRIIDYCNDVPKRHTLTPVQRQNLHMYSESLARRIEEAQYGMHEVEALYDQPDMESTEILGSLNTRMSYRCAVFWTMSYSVFDILANAANTVHEVETEERRVSFKVIRAPDWSKAVALLKEATHVQSRPYFKRLDSLRNCALHRRSVYLEKHEIDVDAAYLPYDSTGPLKAQRQWLVCDDPNATPPTTSAHIELRQECVKILKGLLEDVVKLLKSI